MKLVLFDIDGTLVLTGGAGGRALGGALRRHYGLGEGMGPVRPDGKTDPQIIREVLSRNGLQMSEFVPPEFFDIYLVHLREEMELATDFRVLAGVPSLIESLLAQKADFHLGVATGNIREGARMKLDRAGLSPCFAFGGYGCDAEDRTRLIRIAIERGTAQVAPREVKEVYVIGDTPNDIVHGRAAGACTIAVATGNYSTSDLAQYSPDFLVASLEPHQPVLQFMQERT